MTTDSTLNENKVSQISDTIKALPQKMVFTTQTIIKMLLPEIDAAIARGYTYAELADVIEKQGVKMKESTLKRYLRVARCDSGNSAKKRSTKRKQ